MKSSVTGRAYQISVALPDGYSREHAPYPVLYAADANVQFGTLVETARVFAQIPPLIIVGIGYETHAQGFVWDPRAVDLTPAPNDGSPGSGHAAEFLAFIRNDLVPSIERNYNASQDRAWTDCSKGSSSAAPRSGRQRMSFNLLRKPSPPPDGHSRQGYFFQSDCWSRAATAPV
jgi:predicted alpha/beta superfamily hydrolase